MPRTKIESLVFTAITAWIMVYIMTLYNKILVTKHFLNSIPKGHPLIHVLRTAGLCPTRYTLLEGIHSLFRVYVC